MDDEEYDDFDMVGETGPPIRMPRELLERQGARELERVDEAKQKSEMVQAREYAQERLLRMRNKAMDAIELALESEDEKIRLDAAKVWLSKTTPTVAPERAESEEIIEVTSKATLDEVQSMIEKQMRQAKGEK